MKNNITDEKDAVEKLIESLILILIIITVIVLLSNCSIGFNIKFDVIQSTTIENSIPK